MSKVSTKLTIYNTFLSDIRIPRDAMAEIESFVERNGQNLKDYVEITEIEAIDRLEEQVESLLVKISEDFKLFDYQMRMSKINGFIDLWRDL